MCTFSMVSGKEKYQLIRFVDVIGFVHAHFSNYAVFSKIPYMSLKDMSHML